MLFFQIFTSGPIDTNAILLACEETRKAAVIDPALGSTSQIIRVAEKKGYIIEKILLTHTHFDHIADVFELKSKTGAEVYVHPLDAPNLEVPGSDGLPLYFDVRGVKPDHLLSEDEVIKLGKLLIEVIHTPGHSPGCVCFYLRDQDILFSGDTLFRGTYGGLHLPTAQPMLMKPSLKKLGLLPERTRVIPGHGEETSIGMERHLCH